MIKNLDFTGRIENSDDRFRGYEGCYSVKSVLKRLKIAEEDCIVDIGCGKGLFLYYASKFKFQKIDGIEYSNELVEIAKRNVSIISDDRIHIFYCDAREYTDYKKYNYFFINNPFSAEIMKEVIKKIKEVYKCTHKQVTVIYQFPFNQDLFIKSGFKVVYEKFPNSVLTLG